MFRLGDAVVFDPNTLNPDYWNNFSDEEKERYYGSLGFKDGKEQ